MLWSKQFYHYDVDKWLEECGSRSLQGESQEVAANYDGHYMYNGDIISMPDKWEYPWYAAWDLAFNVLALYAGPPDSHGALLELMLRDGTCTPTGRFPPTSGTSAT